MTVSYQVLKRLCMSYQAFTESFLGGPFSWGIIYISVAASKYKMISMFQIKLLY